MRLTWEPPQNPEGRHVGSMNLAVWTCICNHAVHSWNTPPRPRYHDGCICPVARQLSTTMRTGQRLHCITLCVIMRKTDITLRSLRKQYFKVFGAGNRLFLIGRFTFSHWSIHARIHVVFLFIYIFISFTYLVKMSALEALTLVQFFSVPLQMLCEVQPLVGDTLRKRLACKTCWFLTMREEQ